MWGDGSESKSICCTSLRTRVCAHSTRLRSQAWLQIPIIPVLRDGGGAEKEDCFLTTSAAKTEQASGPVRACLRGIRTRAMDEDTWCPSLVSVHAYTTRTYTHVRTHWSARTHTNNKIEKKRIKVGEQSQETGSAQVRRVPADEEVSRKSLGTRWEGRAVFQHTWRPDFCRTMWPVIPV